MPIAAFRAALDFFYCGRVSCKRDGLEILKAALFLQSAALRDYCEVQLAEVYLNSSNCTTYLALAVEHELQQLKAAALRFIVANGAVVLQEHQCIDSSTGSTLQQLQLGLSSACSTAPSPTSTAAASASSFAAPAINRSSSLENVS